MDALQREWVIMSNKRVFTRTEVVAHSCGCCDRLEHIIARTQVAVKVGATEVQLDRE